jgi:hypothetical protein
MTPGPEPQEHRFYELIGKAEPLTDDDLKALRECLHQTNFSMVRPHILGKAQLRVDVDLIAAIRQFDKASGQMAAVTVDLAEKTRKLTVRIYWLTVVMIVVGLANVAASGWYPLVWWVKHGFGF